MFWALLIYLASFSCPFFFCYLAISTFFSALQVETWKSNPLIGLILLGDNYSDDESICIFIFIIFSGEKCIWSSRFLFVTESFSLNSYFRWNYFLNKFDCATVFLGKIDGVPINDKNVRIFSFEFSSPPVFQLYV